MITLYADFVSKIDLVQRREFNHNIIKMCKQCPNPKSELAKTFFNYGKHIIIQDTIDALRQEIKNIASLKKVFNEKNEFTHSLYNGCYMSILCYTGRIYSIIRECFGECKNLKQLKFYTDRVEEESSKIIQTNNSKINPDDWVFILESSIRGINQTFNVIIS